jgi:hypothetical protein
MPNKPASIEIVEEKEGRFVLTTFADGTVERTPIDPDLCREPRWSA